MMTNGFFLSLSLSLSLFLSLFLVTENRLANNLLLFYDIWTWNYIWFHERLKRPAKKRIKKERARKDGSCSRVLRIHIGLFPIVLNRQQFWFSSLYCQIPHYQNTRFVENKKKKRGRFYFIRFHTNLRCSTKYQNQLTQSQ